MAKPLKHVVWDYLEIQLSQGPVDYLSDLSTLLNGAWESVWEVAHLPMKSFARSCQKLKEYCTADHELTLTKTISKSHSHQSIYTVVIES